MNTVKIVQGRSGQVWPLVLGAARECRQEGRRLVLYVPEQYTLQAERDLITDLRLPGLLDIQVISPRKLRQQVAERMGSTARKTLNEFGRAMAVHRVMREKADELVYYRNMADLPGAVRRVEEALEELEESELTREELSSCAGDAATGTERAKLLDLRIILDTYKALIAEQFDDDKTVWTDTMNRLERGGLWDGVDLAVYGFDSIRPDLRELLVKIGGKVHSAKVFLTMDAESAPDGRIFVQQHQSVRRLKRALEDAGLRAEEIRPAGERKNCAPAIRFLDRNLFSLSPEKWEGETRGEIALFSGASPWEEAEHIASALHRWHEEGIPWSGMAIALPPESELTGMLRANLRINGIPFTYQQKDPAADHPVCRMLLSALGCLSDGYRTDEMITMARSGYSTLSKEEGLALENYALARGIEGKRWQKPFTAGADAEKAEELRIRLINPVEELRRALREAGNAAESVEAIVGFLETEGVWKRLNEQEKELLDREMYRDAVINRQVWKLLMDLLEQMWALLGKRRAAIGDLKQMLSSALSAAQIAALPERQGGVMIGEVGHLLAGETEALILPSAQDGILSAPESGWLSDQERKRMEEATGRTIGISREEACLIRKYDYYRTLTLPGKRLMITWSLRGEDGGALQPDGLIGQIRALFPQLKTGGGMAGEAEPEAPATPVAALDGLGVLLADLKNGKREDLPAAWKTAAVQLLHSGVYGETARGILRELLPEETKKTIDPETARRLFMTDRLSVSRLEQFASCPYRHFIDYGLRPVRQERFEFRNDEVGSFFHEALDRYFRTAGQEPEWPDFSDERTDSVMGGILKELTEEWKEGPLAGDAVGFWQGESYLRRVRHAARVLTRFAANSDFRTIATERGFGENEEMPPVTLTLRDGTQTLIRGKIDRIDTYENGEGLWLRIVDNKSSGRKPSAEKMATGEQLQLMIYLKAATDSMPGARPAGALYFPVEDKEVAVETDETAAVEKERMKNVRMKGLVTAREEIIRAMDRDISPYSVDQVFNKDGSISKSADWAVEESTLSAVMDAAVEKAGELCGRMRAGEIEASPITDGEDTPCRYCDYHGICRAGKENEQPREKGITFRDIAAETQRKKALREEEK